MAADPQICRSLMNLLAINGNLSKHCPSVKVAKLPLNDRSEKLLPSDIRPHPNIVIDMEEPCKKSVARGIGPTEEEKIISIVVLNSAISFASVNA